ncbi:LuxR C-terminal-related transcriptional regulator [Ornithinimicrobium cavernae]|uniref:LuxR C-terminal-related transcriptional regulator n=1 Tax=Ornithinimicrobium cavernae TaxID=2666047 RepID=UPI000D698E53|nr:LuxR family transcriptional regulator [Ornithinimicrobium cavernae]
MQVPQPPESGPDGLVTVARAEWPFVGRGEEFDLITAAIGTDAQGGSGRGEPPGSGSGGAVIFAPAGVGKTRLLTEVRRWAEHRGVRTALVIATEAGSRTPYGAVLHLLPAGTADPADRVTWHAAFAAALRSADCRTLLLVDDAQHLDHGSAALVLQLAMEGAVTPVVAVRRGASVPDPITALWKDGLALRVDLQPFSATEMRALISRALGGSVSDRTLSRLAAVSDGNVLYARELVAGALEAGSLRRREDVWTWDEQVVLAPRLVDAVGWRLAALSDEGRQALALVAIGEPLPLAVAERLIDAEVLSALEESVLVCTDGRGELTSLRLCHPLYGEVVLGQLGHLTRRRLVAALADALEADPLHRDEAVVRVASWRLEIGGELPPETLLRAAERANQTFDHELAERLARAGIVADRAGSELRCSLVVELARALVWRNHFEEASALLLEIEDEVVASDDEPLQDTYLDMRFWACYVGLGQADETRRLLDRFTATSGGSDPGTRGGEGEGKPGLAAYRANILLGEGLAREAVALAEPLLDSTEVPELQRLLALETSGEALGYLGLYTRAALVWDRMRSLAQTGHGRAATAATEADMQELWCAQLDGRFGEILPVVSALHSQFESSQDVATRGLASLALGRIFLMAGRPSRAQAVLLDAVADFRTVDLGGTLAWALSLLSQAAVLTGRPEDARRWRDEAREHHARGGSARQAADLTAADVWIAVAEGDGTAASALALEGAAAYPQFELPRARLLHLAVRVGERGAAVVTDLRDIADRVEFEYPTLLADHAEALRAGDGTALEEVAHRFGDRGLPLLAAEAASQAARAHRAAGSTDGTRRASALLARLTARFERITTPALREPELVADLSRRELDVARLAALGLSNAQIAERLVVSVRTVESHLYQAYAKLGVERRTDLGRLLPPQ